MAEGLRLPEVQWQFRRYFSFGLTVIAAGGVGGVVWKLDDPEALKVIGLALIGLIALQALLYMAGPTITDLARLAAAVKGAVSPSSEPTP